MAEGNTYTYQADDSELLRGIAVEFVADEAQVHLGKDVVGAEAVVVPVAPGVALTDEGRMMSAVLRGEDRAFWIDDALANQPESVLLHFIGSIVGDNPENEGFAVQHQAVDGHQLPPHKGYPVSQQEIDKEEGARPYIQSTDALLPLEVGHVASVLHKTGVSKDPEEVKLFINIDGSLATINPAEWRQFTRTISGLKQFVSRNARRDKSGLSDANWHRAAQGLDDLKAIDPRRHRYTHESFSWVDIRDQADEIVQPISDYAKLGSELMDRRARTRRRKKDAQRNT